MGNQKEGIKSLDEKTNHKPGHNQIAAKTDSGVITPVCPGTAASYSVSDLANSYRWLRKHPASHQRRRTFRLPLAHIRAANRREC
jgi:hypothetical protein